MNRHLHVQITHTASITPLADVPRAQLHVADRLSHAVIDVSRTLLSVSSLHLGWFTYCHLTATSSTTIPRLTAVTFTIIFARVIPEASIANSHSSRDQSIHRLARPQSVTVTVTIFELQPQVLCAKSGDRRPSFNIPAANWHYTYFNSLQATVDSPVT